MIDEDQSQTSSLQNRIGRKLPIAIDLYDFENANKSADIRERLQKMELLARKLKVQLTMCALAIILTTILYLTIWYNSDCWALPFQKSVCKQTRDLPLMTTDRNTLADAVDEFLLALQTQIVKFHDVIKLPLIADRQTMSNVTKNEIGQLLYQHSADLVGFSAVKREDERLQELEFAIEHGYILIPISSCISFIFMISVPVGMECCKPPAIIKQ
ncbi:hypothetical protein Ddc_20282 [Ditylenchus destructor]|nr:hypothetical protein Ddc_20282 [Ditylenchus destructor]